MPASVSQAEATFVDVCQAYHEKLVTDGPAANTDVAAILAAYNGDEDAEVARLQDAVRAGELAQLSGPLKQFLDRALLDWVHSSVIQFSGTSVTNELFVRLRQYLDDVGPFAGGSVDKDVTARGWTRGSPSLVSTPAMNIYRITVDEYGQAIETGKAQVMRLNVVTPAGQTPKIVRVDPGDAGRDGFDAQGPGGPSLDLQLFDYRTANGLLQNPTLAHGVTAAASLSASSVSGWTISGTVVAGTQLFRGLTSSVKMTADADYMEQTITARPKPRTPYLLMVWVYPEAGFTGTVTLAWGSKSQAFNSLTASQWNLLVIDRDLDTFPEQWDAVGSSNRVRITATTAHNDFTVGLVQMVECKRDPSNCWLAGSNGITAASPADVAYGATGSITDSISESGQMQRVLEHAYPNLVEAYLPTTGTNLIAFS